MIADLIQAYLLGLFLTFTPCVYPVLPIFLLYITGSKTSRGKAFIASILFVTGFIVSFSLFIILMTIARDYIIDIIGLSLMIESLIPKISALFIVLGVALFTPLKLIFYKLSTPTPKFKKITLLNAFMLGLIFTIIAAPCGAGSFLAFLVSIMASSSQPNSLMIDVLLRSIMYSLGGGTPFIILGLVTGQAAKRLHKRITSSIIIRRSSELTGILLIVFGIFTLIYEENIDLILLTTASDIERITMLLIPLIYFIAGITFIRFMTRLPYKAGRIKELVFMSAGLITISLSYVLNIPITLLSMKFIPEIIPELLLTVGLIELTIGTIFLLKKSNTLSKISAAIPILPNIKALLLILTSIMLFASYRKSKDISIKWIGIGTLLFALSQINLETLPLQQYYHFLKFIQVTFLFAHSFTLIPIIWNLRAFIKEIEL